MLSWYPYRLGKGWRMILVLRYLLYPFYWNPTSFYVLEWRRDVLLLGVVGKGTDISLLSWLLHSSLNCQPTVWTTLLILGAFSVSLLSWGSCVNYFQCSVSTLISTDLHRVFQFQLSLSHFLQLWQIGFNSRATCCWGSSKPQDSTSPVNFSKCLRSPWKDQTPLIC